MWLGPPSMKHQMTDFALGSSGGNGRFAVLAANPSRAKQRRERDRAKAAAGFQKKLSPGVNWLKSARRSCLANPR